MTPNPLMIVAVIFALSFSGRAIGIANATLNKASDTPKAVETPDRLAAAPNPAAAEELLPEETLKAPVDAPKRVAMADTPQKLFDFSSAEQSPNNYGDLLSAMKSRAEDIERRNIEVENRVRVLEILEERIASKLAELQKSNDDLSKLVSFADEASKQDIKLLSKMYEQMKPKKAGEIFDKMNPEFAAGFLTEMNSESAALILTNMSTDQAYQTSMIIASRNAAVKNQ